MHYSGITMGLFYYFIFQSCPVFFFPRRPSFIVVSYFINSSPRAAMGDKSVETLGSKIRFLSVLVAFSPHPLKTMLIFVFLRLHRPQRLHNIELGGRCIRELTLHANKLEQMLKYRKASFPKCLSYFCRSL